MTDAASSAPVRVAALDAAAAERTAFPLLSQLHPHLDRAAFAARLAAVAPDALFFAATAGETAVGFACARLATTFSRGAHLYLDDLVVDAEWRGRGVGAALLEAVEAEATARALPVVRLHARPESLRFYERHGYRPGASRYVMKPLG